jgi:hypothetical protein
VHITPAPYTLDCHRRQLKTSNDYALLITTRALLILATDDARGWD